MILDGLVAILALLLALTVNITILGPVHRGGRGGRGGNREDKGIDHR